MICRVKTPPTTYTFTCSCCKIDLIITAKTIRQAEDTAIKMGWEEMLDGQAICADCAEAKEGET